MNTRRLTNPLSEDFHFRWDGVWYQVPSFGTVDMVGYIAVHAAKHLAKKILISRGRYSDLIQEGKRTARSVNMSEIEYIAEYLLDMESDTINLKEVVAASAKARKAGDRDSEGGNVQRRVGTVKVVGEEGEEGDEEPVQGKPSDSKRGRKARTVLVPDEEEVEDEMKEAKSEEGEEGKPVENDGDLTP